MIGLIVTGHGSFATGLTSGLKLLAGEPEQYEAVDFLPEDSIDILTGKLEAAIEALKDCGSILILADLTGGSPFNVSVRLKLAGKAKMEVVGGTNLPVVLDAYMSRTMIPDAAALAASSSEAGRNQIVVYQKPEETDAEDDDEIEFEE